MNTYQAKNIINVAMAGHSGAGKTSLAEAMLYLAGASDRRGKVGEGNTVCDYDPEEIRFPRLSRRSSGKTKRSTFWTPPVFSTLRAACTRRRARRSPS